MRERASHIKPGQSSLSDAQRLVMANVHGTINLGTHHRLERLVEDRPGLKGLIRNSVNNADAIPQKVLVEREILSSTSNGKAVTHAAEGSAVTALSSTGIGAVLHTGTAVVSIPHTSVEIAPGVLKSTGSEVAAKLVSRATYLKNMSIDRHHL